MAFLDFLNQGIGGMTPAQSAEGVAGEGNITTVPSTPIGPTYGDITRSAMQYGSPAGSSTPALARATIPNSGWAQNRMNSLDPNAPKQQKALMGQDTGQDDSLAQIAKYLTLLLGGA